MLNTSMLQYVRKGKEKKKRKEKRNTIHVNEYIYF